MLISLVLQYHGLPWHLTAYVPNSKTSSFSTADSIATLTHSNRKKDIDYNVYISLYILKIMC